MKNGIKILNLQGADIMRNNLENKNIMMNYEAVFSNSLLKTKLEEVGMINHTNIKNGTYTNDIINVRFDVPVSNLNIDESLKTEYENIGAKIDTLKIKANDIRIILYQKGFKLDFKIPTTLRAKKGQTVKIDGKHYILKNKESDEELDRELITHETINYRYWFRSSAKARVGHAMFISDKLYDKVIEWQRMGIEFPEGEEAMVVEMLAYMALTSSTIEDTIEIDPRTILVVDDLQSKYPFKCANVIVNDTGICEVNKGISDIISTLFDGQALLDESMFRESKAGMKLLRHHFFKACAFRTRIQDFMKDHCENNGLDYNTYTVKDRYGNDILVKDIKMITTENAMKWEKFFKGRLSEGYKKWIKAVNADKNIFGICKEDHQSKHGEQQQMSYQMLNTIPANKEQLESIAAESINCINTLKNNDNVKFIEFLDKNKNITNPNEMMIDLYKTNELFCKTEFFKDFKSDIISEQKKRLRKGKVMVEGDNLTVVGNPYLMLLHSVKEVKIINGYVETIDPTLPILKKYISVYTKRFKDNEELVGFRNPHNAPNNIALFKNIHNDLMEKYFNFSNNIMAVNLVRTELQDLANGLDQDSDFMLVTNNTTIVDIVKSIFRSDTYACIVNKIPQSKKTYINTLLNHAIIDNLLSKGKNDIGVSSNLAQFAMSKYSDSKKKEILDKVIILSVLAQVAIDNAKRQYEVDLDKEIRRLRFTGDKKPLFFYYVSSDNQKEFKVVEKSTTGTKVKRKFTNKYKAKQYAEENNLEVIETKVKKTKSDFDKKMNCTMNILQEIIDDNVINGSKIKGEKISNDEMIKNHNFINKVAGKAKHEQCEKIKDLVETYNSKIIIFNSKISELNEQALSEAKRDFKYEEEDIVDTIIETISKMKISEKTINTLIISAFAENKKNSNTHIRTKLLNVLYRAKTKLFLEQFKQSN